jgi:hypothetical protein
MHEQQQLSAKGDHRPQIDQRALRRRGLARALGPEDRTKDGRLLRELSQPSVAVKRPARAPILQEVLVNARVAEVVPQAVSIDAKNERVGRTL